MPFVYKFQDEELDKKQKLTFVEGAKFEAASQLKEELFTVMWAAEDATGKEMRGERFIYFIDSFLHVKFPQKALEGERANKISVLELWLEYREFAGNAIGLAEKEAKAEDAQSQVNLYWKKLAFNEEMLDACLSAATIALDDEFQDLNSCLTLIKQATWHCGLYRGLKAVVELPKVSAHYHGKKNEAIKDKMHHKEWALGEWEDLKEKYKFNKSAFARDCKKWLKEQRGYELENHRTISERWLKDL